MSWNQPATKTPAKPPQRRLKWPIIATAVVGCCLCALLFLFRTDNEKHSEHKAPKTSAKAATKPSTANTETQLQEEVPVVTEIRPAVKKEHRPVTEEDMVNPVNNDPNKRVVRLKPQPKKLFRHTSEELIAGLIDTEPGEMVIGEIPYHKFENDFTSAAIEKIELSDDDTEYERELKLAVEETKKAIRDIMGKEGRSFADIMTEARQEQQYLAQYRLDLEDELRQIRKMGEYDSEEYDRFVEAANNMLRDKGASPLKTPAVYYRQLKLNQMRKGAQ